MTGGISEHNNVKHNIIVFCLQTHPINLMTWLSSILNTFYGVKMFQDIMNDDVLTIIDDWILEQA